MGLTILDEWLFRRADLKGEAEMHNAGRCPKDPTRCYPCYEDELEQNSETENTAATERGTVG